MYMYGAISDFHVSKDQNKGFYGILSFYPRGSDASIVRSAATATLRRRSVQQQHNVSCIVFAKFGSLISRMD